MTFASLARPVVAALGLVATALQAASAQAQDYPNRPVTFVVPYAGRRRARRAGAHDRRSGWRSGSASRSWSRTAPAPAP